MISKVGGNAAQPMPSSNSGTVDVSKLESEKKLLQEQLNQLKSNPKKGEAEQKAAERQKQILQNKIANIEKQIQAALKKNANNANNTTNTQNQQIQQNQQTMTDPSKIIDVYA